MLQKKWFRYPVWQSETIWQCIFSCAQSAQGLLCESGTISELKLSWILLLVWVRYELKTVQGVSLQYKCVEVTLAAEYTCASRKQADPICSINWTSWLGLNCVRVSSHVGPWTCGAEAPDVLGLLWEAHIVERWPAQGQVHHVQCLAKLSQVSWDCGYLSRATICSPPVSNRGICVSCIQEYNQVQIWGYAAQSREMNILAGAVTQTAWRAVTIA